VFDGFFTHNGMVSLKPERIFISFTMNKIVWFIIIIVIFSVSSYVSTLPNTSGLFAPYFDKLQTFIVTVTFRDFSHSSAST
jgi:hypothetical protein